MWEVLGGWDLSESHLCSTGLFLPPRIGLGWDRSRTIPTPNPGPGSQAVHLSPTQARGPRAIHFWENRGHGGREKGMGRGQHTAEVWGQGWEAHPALTTPCEAGTARVAPGWAEPL